MEMSNLEMFVGISEYPDHELYPAHVGDGLPDVWVGHDLLEDLEASDLTLDIISL